MRIGRGRRNEEERSRNDTAVDCNMQIIKWIWIITAQNMPLLESNSYFVPDLKHEGLESHIFLTLKKRKSGADDCL